MRFGAENAVQVERDRHVALRRIEAGRDGGGAESGGGSGGGGVAEELEIGNEALRPFAGGG